MTYGFKRIKKGDYEPTWNSLRRYECPKWFRNAKLGIWAHWGPQAVPMMGDWYARLMYIEGTDAYNHHLRTYGHPSEHGWKDMVDLWKAEKFNPKELMKLYVNAGAKYFCTTAMHHDNFDLYDSSYNRWNSVNMGPKRDIASMWKQAAKEYDLPFGMTEHLGAAYNWFCRNKGCDKKGPYKGIAYDGNDEEYVDLYLDNKEELEYDTGLYLKEYRWYTKNEDWQKHWFDRMKDLIDKYQPDLLYTDGGLPFGEYGLAIVSHLYNTSKDVNGSNQAVYTQKDKSPLVYKIGVLDVERGVIDDAQLYPWQTDTCVGSWYYDMRATYKSAKHVIEMLVDIVAKNGNLLLNFPLRPDGTLDDECLFILNEMAEWMQINSEGIHDTRPWDIAMEGDNRFPKQQFSEETGWNESEVIWDEKDYRFTSKDNVIYAFQMGWSGEDTAKIKSMVGQSHVGSAGMAVVDIESVELLGAENKLEFYFEDDGLVITGLPQKRPTEYAHCYKITLKNQ